MYLEIINHHPEFILNFSEHKYSPTDVLEYLWKAASIFFCNLYNDSSLFTRGISNTPTIVYKKYWKNYAS